MQFFYIFCACAFFNFLRNFDASVDAKGEIAQKWQKLYWAQIRRTECSRSSFASILRQIYLGVNSTQIVRTLVRWVVEEIFFSPQFWFSFFEIRLLTTLLHISGWFICTYLLFHLIYFPAVCDPNVPDFTNACMGCICTASSKCNQTIGCISGVIEQHLMSQLKFTYTIFFI